MFGKSGNKELIRVLTSLAVSVVTVLVLLGVAAAMTASGKIGEEMTQTVACCCLFLATVAGSAIFNSRIREGRLLRGFALGITYFAIVFVAGKASGLEPCGTGNTLAVLAVSVVGGLTGAVITNKKQRYKR